MLTRRFGRGFYSINPPLGHSPAESRFFEFSRWDSLLRSVLLFPAARIIFRSHNSFNVGLVMCPGSRVTTRSSRSRYQIFRETKTWHILYSSAMISFAWIITLEALLSKFTILRSGITRRGFTFVTPSDAHDFCPGLTLHITFVECLGRCVATGSSFYRFKQFWDTIMCNIFWCRV